MEKMEKLGLFYARFIDNIFTRDSGGGRSRDALLHPPHAHGDESVEE